MVAKILDSNSNLQDSIDQCPNTNKSSAIGPQSRLKSIKRAKKEQWIAQNGTNEQQMNP